MFPSMPFQATPQLPFKTPPKPSSRDGKALNRGTLGGGQLQVETNQDRSGVLEYTYSDVLLNWGFYISNRVKGPEYEVLA